MQYLYLINGETVENIVSPEWSDDLETFSNPFSFTTYSLYEVGSLFQIMTKNGEIVLKGIITDFEQSEENVFRYSGYDCGFYINQNEIIEQFKSMKISDAIKKLCQNYSIPVGDVPEISATVTEIFKDKKLSDVLKTLIDLAKSKGADCMVTAEVKHHVAVYAKEVGMTVIECQHYTMEHCYLTRLTQILEMQATHEKLSVDFILSQKEVNPRF